MKIENALQAIEPEDFILPPTILPSPHAPSWLEAIASLAQRFFAQIAALFSSAPKEEKPEPAPEIPKLIEEIEQRNRQNSYAPQIQRLVTNAAISYGISYMTGNYAPFAAFVTSTCVNGGTLVLQKVGNYTFPQINTNWKKLAALAISARVVWVASEKAGYPLGYIFLSRISMNALETISQAIQPPPKLTT